MDEKLRAELKQLLSEIRHGEGPPRKDSALSVAFDKGYALACTEIRERLEGILSVGTDKEEDGAH